MWHRTCRWLGLDKEQEATGDQHVEPEFVPEQRGLPSPAVFSPDGWVYRQSWLCEVLHRMDVELVRGPAQEVSAQPPNYESSISFVDEAACGSKRRKSLHEKGRKSWRRV